MLKKISGVILGVLCLTSTVVAGDMEKGREAAKRCIMCHGVNGESRIRTYPSLKGMDEQKFIAAIYAYRNGEKEGNLAGMMRSQALGLSEEEIKNMAAYFSSLK
ncbi:cytochrome C biogenesis protein CcsB [Vibrio albus]|jgi:cytochrome c553|uniref:Cytochrome C biogenesis protein CcsB n=1 Tax=Vibrio albus TaxID=2200953 RepID=A0A2U3BCE0_9VIBR|nr:cytochrome c [Vibrio albus]PWI34456.1 cytochrome C biogenesis protein CcsB [Vibrio albus]